MIDLYSIKIDNVEIPVRVPKRVLEEMIAAHNLGMGYAYRVEEVKELDIGVNINFADVKSLSWRRV